MVVFQSSCIYCVFLSQDCSVLEDFQSDECADIKALLYTDSDLTVTPIMDNPKVNLHIFLCSVCRFVKVTVFETWYMDHS